MRAITLRGSSKLRKLLNSKLLVLISHFVSKHKKQQIARRVWAYLLQQGRKSKKLILLQLGRSASGQWGGSFCLWSHTRSSTASGGSWICLRCIPPSRPATHRWVSPHTSSTFTVEERKIILPIFQIFWWIMIYYDVRITAITSLLFLDQKSRSYGYFLVFTAAIKTLKNRISFAQLGRKWPSKSLLESPWWEHSNGVLLGHIRPFSAEFCGLEVSLQRVFFSAAEKWPI